MSGPGERVTFQSLTTASAAAMPVEHLPDLCARLQETETRVEIFFWDLWHGERLLYAMKGRVESLGSDGRIYFRLNRHHAHLIPMADVVAIRLTRTVGRHIALFKPVLYGTVPTRDDDAPARAQVLRTMGVSA